MVFPRLTSEYTTVAMFGRNQRDEAGYLSQRLRMVDDQLRRRDIVDAAVLAVMSAVPRHEFVPPEMIDEAYEDHPVPIGCDQTISQPYIVASMTQELGVGPESEVLEIGTGCGYQTAVLAEIVKHVYSIEIIPELLAEAEERLKRLGYANISTRLGNGALGWPEHAPYDGILAAAAAYEIPPALIEQLADNGKMVIPLVTGGGYHQDLVLITKSGGQISQQTLYGVRFVPLRSGG